MKTKRPSGPLKATALRQRGLVLPLPGQQAVTALPRWLPCSGFPEQCNSLCATGWTHSLSCPGSLPQALTSLLLIQALISQRSLVSQSFGWPSGVPPAGVNGTGWGSPGFGRGGLSPTAGLQSWEMSSDHATQVMWGIEAAGRELGAQRACWAEAA